MMEQDEGKTVWMGGVGVTFKLYGKDTGGSFSIVEHPLQPRSLVPPHMHTKEDEFSIVVQGKVGARVGDQVIEGTPGCYIFKPRKIPHTFWNPLDEPSRLIEIISPPGFEKFFGEAAKLFPPAGLPDLKKLTRVCSRYRTVLGWQDWIPELSARYNLKLFGR